MAYIRHDLYKYLVWAIITFLVVTIGLHALSPHPQRMYKHPVNTTPFTSQEFQPASMSAH